MGYDVVFASERVEKEFKSALGDISNKNMRDEVMYRIEDLSDNPRPFPPNPKLVEAMPIFGRLAQYRIKVGRYRIFYDVNDRLRKVYIIALRIRDNRTYRRSK